MRRILVLILVVFSFHGLSRAEGNDTVAIRQFAEYGDATAIENVRPVKNIVIMIGDGMGFEAITAARIHSFGRGVGLALDRMPVTGQNLSYSLSEDIITDSAASGTALACGVKTLNGRIAQDRHAARLKTILELAGELGKSTGLVATSKVNHATPASFASHVKSRNNYWEIARQMSRAPLDVLLGGGYGYFLPGSHPESFRDDELDLLGEMRSRGASVTMDPGQLGNLDPDRVKALVGLFARDDLDRTARSAVNLSEMTGTALKILSRNPRGFFMMVEGSQIDWAGHGHDLEYSVGETLEFDRAVGVVLSFAEKHGETLVIVTADHETGGLSLNKASEKDKTLTAGWTTGSHTANVVPVFAYGPNAEAFGAVIHNHHIPQLAVQGWGVKNFTGFAYGK